MADQTRIELAISSVTGRHVNRYTTGPLIFTSSYIFNHTHLYFYCGILLQMGDSILSQQLLAAYGLIGNATGLM